MKNYAITRATAVPDVGAEMCSVQVNAWFLVCLSERIDAYAVLLSSAYLRCVFFLNVCQSFSRRALQAITIIASSRLTTVNHTLSTRPPSCIERAKVILDNVTEITIIYSSIMSYNCNHTHASTSIPPLVSNKGSPAHNLMIWAALNENRHHSSIMSHHCRNHTLPFPPPPLVSSQRFSYT